MGGKKKTKWRKLPLEEFTKKPPTKDEKATKEDAHPSDFSGNESNYTPSYNEGAENVLHYTEPYEYIDGLYYPTSCTVYNPADVGVYANYMMPVENCYYYYTVPEMPQIQEYAPLPYQEYASALPKDTVYLILPTQTLRQSPNEPCVDPEWQNKRRRRYKGYAEYAIIPEKNSASKVEGKEPVKRGGQQIRSGRNSHHLNRSNSVTEANNFEGLERNPQYNKTYELTSKNIAAADSNIEKKLISESKGMNNIPKKNYQTWEKSQEACGIHKRITGEITESTTDKKCYDTQTLKNNTETSFAENTKNKLDKIVNNLSEPFIYCQNNPQTTYLNVENKIVDKNEADEHANKIDNTDLTEKKDLRQHLTGELTTETKLKNTYLNPSSNEEVPQNLITSTAVSNNEKTVQDMPTVHCQPSLPDILSTLNKSSSRVKDSDTTPKNMLHANKDLDKGKSLTSKPILSQITRLPSSEALHNEMEMELKYLKNLNSLHANESIYKLAYDENVSEQSENSRSPSPIDPESHVPRSITNTEILVHEADSGSEAGSEDVELLPHRYESESFLNENKHVYVNRLSLAVELLRTQENLPYDKEFKRVVGENNLANNDALTDIKQNISIQDEPHSSNALNFANETMTKGSILNELAMQNQLKNSNNYSTDSAIFSDTDFGSLDDDDDCETPKETIQAAENENNKQTGFWRFGVQARNYFSPRGTLSFNPCFCTIM